MTFLKQRMRRASKHSIMLVLALIPAFVLGYLSGGTFVSPTAQASPAGFHSASTSVTPPVRGKAVHATSSKTMPRRTAAERQDLESRLASKHSLKAPSHGQDNRYDLKPANAAAPNPRVGTPRANSTFVTEQQIDTTLGVCPMDCSTSSIMETSIAANGRNIVETGNWFVAFSVDNATTGNYLDPFTWLGQASNGFCCDQQVIYEPSRDVFILTQVFYTGNGNAINHLDLIAMSSTDPTSVFVYELYPTLFGLPSGTIMDNPQIQFSTDKGYLTWTDFDGMGNLFNTHIARFDLTTFAAHGQVSFDTYQDPGVFAFSLADGATDTMYWGSNWYTSGTFTGNHMRLYFWGDRNNTLNVGDKSIDPWNLLNSGTGNCASQDNVVTNWCSRADSRRGAAYRSRAGYKGRGSPLLSFAWNAQANPNNGLPFPYVVREYFDLYSVTYKGHEDMYSTSYAILYPGMAVAPGRGYVGGVVSWGGGTGQNHYYPGTAVFFESPDSNGPFGDFQFSLPGQANTTSAGAWGDFNTIRPLWPDGLHFIAGEWRVTPVVNASSVPTPYLIEFGQVRDHSAYLRWKNS